MHQPTVSSGSDPRSLANLCCDARYAMLVLRDASDSEDICHVEPGDADLIPLISAQNEDNTAFAPRKQADMTRRIAYLRPWLRRRATL